MARYLMFALGSNPAVDLPAFKADEARRDHLLAVGMIRKIARRSYELLHDLPAERVRAPEVHSFCNAALIEQGYRWVAVQPALYSRPLPSGWQMRP